MRLVILLISVILFSSCDNRDVRLAKSELTDNWIFVGYKQGDVLRLPCDTATVKVTMSIKQNNKIFEIGGRSFVNIYISEATIRFESDGKKGKISVGDFRMTEMGGPKVLMDCESRYVHELSKVQFIEFVDDKLLLFRETDALESKLPDILIFEKEN